MERTKKKIDMDYEKKYNEALDWMRQLYPCLYGQFREDAERFFPELRESEDERIRKEMIHWLKGFIGEEEGCGYTEDEIRERIAYLEKQKEQPQVADASKMEHEVDLEKFAEKIKTFQGRYKHPEIVSIKGAMAFMARLFYQYPNTAREWYESLPKATMDNVRKEE